MGVEVDMSKLPDWPRGMNRETAAAYLGVSTSTLDSWRKNGLISYLPNTTMFDRRAIDAKLDELSGLRNATQPKLQPRGSRFG
jgi:hypothetical protein